jgi:hypothetical protein
MPGAGDPRDPAWILITQALKIGQDYARDRSYAWKGDSCFVVAAIALRAIILTRQGRGTITTGARAGQELIPTANRHDPNLAYADHYLHMRGEAARLGPTHRWRLEQMTRGYDTLKHNIVRVKGTAWPSVSLAEKLVAEAADRLLRESDQPMSAPTAESLYWGLKGIEDGLKDHAANPGIDNGPDWFKQLF